MGAFAAFTPHKSSACAQQRQQRRQRAAAGGLVAQAGPQQPAAPSCGRRGAVAGLLLPALTLQLGGGAARAEETAALNVPELAPTVTGETAAAAAGPTDPSANWRRYIARDFLFAYPPRVKLIEEDLFAKSYDFTPIRAGSAAPVENPVKAQLRSDDGRVLVNVVVRLASTIKPTFTQLTDVSQWGDVKEVANLLLPPGAVVTDYGSAVYPQPPQKGPFGPIERDPVTLYRYEVVLPDQTRVALSVGAQKGQVYVMGAAAAQEQWEGAAEELRRCADTFRLVK